jgi:excisionase family DNA binding protein
VRYSVPQAARLLGISERAVRKRITSGALPAEKTATGWLVELGAVPEAVLAEPCAVPGPQTRRLMPPQT